MLSSNAMRKKGLENSKKSRGYLTLNRNSGLSSWVAHDTCESGVVGQSSRSQKMASGGDFIPRINDMISISMSGTAILHRISHIFVKLMQFFICNPSHISVSHAILYL